MSEGEMIQDQNAEEVETVDMNTIMEKLNKYDEKFEQVLGLILLNQQKQETSLGELEKIKNEMNNQKQQQTIQQQQIVQPIQQQQQLATTVSDARTTKINFQTPAQQTTQSSKKDMSWTIQTEKFKRDGDISDNDSDSQIESNVNIRRRNGRTESGRVENSRRLSYLTGLGEEDESQNRKTLMYQAQPDYSNIELKTLTVKSVHKFMRDIAVYQRKYQTTLPVSTMISQTIIKLLIATSKNEVLNEENFYRLKS